MGDQELPDRVAAITDDVRQPERQPEQLPGLKS
jgi:hypothetical protein